MVSEENERAIEADQRFKCPTCKDGKIGKTYQETKYYNRSGSSYESDVVIWHCTECDGIYKEPKLEPKKVKSK